MHQKSIKIQHISKAYAKVKALSNICFEVNKGELFGLIGPDGSGKTSLFRILTSLLLPDEGEATLEGFDVVKDYKQIRKIVGYMPGKFSLYSDLSVEENLNFFATIFGTSIEENYELIKDIYQQIEPFKKRRAGDLSGGMKQKLALSCALIHKPKVLILDEPTTGVDAVSRKEFWDMLQKLKVAGITIIVATPYMDEAELCDRVALIQKGNILSIDSPEGITRQFQFPLYRIKGKEMFRLLTDLRNYQETLSAHRFGDSIHLTVKTKNKEKELAEWLHGKEHINVETESIQATIEDCFMALMTNDSRPEPDQKVNS